MSLAVNRADSYFSTLYAAPGPNGQMAVIEDVDAQHPGFGYTLRVNGEALVGSPLPSADIRFTRVGWSPDGTRVAFVAETPGARESDDQRWDAYPSDGLWVWSLVPGQPTQFTHHALLNRYAGHWGEEGAQIVTDFAWSPDGALLLAKLDRGGDFSGELALLTPDHNAGDEPIILGHEDGSWSVDGRRILVSGMQTDVGPVLGWVEWIDREVPALTVLLDGRWTNPPLWIQDAVERPDGRIAFLGAPYNPADPGAGPGSSGVSLYVYDPQIGPQPVAFIGAGPVQEAIWNPDRSAVLLRMDDGRTLVARISGAIADISDQVGGSIVTWEP